MALTFATRFPWLPVLVGISLATLIIHAISVLIGTLVALALPTNLISVLAGLAFFAFAGWTLRGDKLTTDDEARAERSTGSVILAVGSAFFLAELGDKTMLATITLATTQDPIGTWLGSTAGMVVADGIAIAIGSWLGTRLPERAIRIGAAALFVVFGAILVAEGLGWL
jgi:putative Ca2+/H+ antiporter (TMEM165/GDT1 family)